VLCLRAGPWARAGPRFCGGTHGKRAKCLWCALLVAVHARVHAGGGCTSSARTRKAHGGAGSAVAGERRVRCSGRRGQLPTGRSAESRAVATRCWIDPDVLTGRGCRSFGGFHRLKASSSPPQLALHLGSHAHAAPKRPLPSARHRQPPCVRATACVLWCVYAHTCTCACGCMCARAVQWGSRGGCVTAREWAWTWLRVCCFGLPIAELMALVCWFRMISRLCALYLSFRARRTLWTLGCAACPLQWQAWSSAHRKIGRVACCRNTLH
jgi:hypothetical protein